MQVIPVSSALGDAFVEYSMNINKIKSVAFLNQSWFYWTNKLATYTRLFIIFCFAKRSILK